MVEGRRHPGGIEVVEWLIGRSNPLNGKNNTNCFIAQLPAMTASVLTLTFEVNTKALTTCGIKHVLQASDNHAHHTVAYLPR